MESRRLVLGIFSAPTLALAAEAGQLACPGGTVPKQEVFPRQSQHAEWCADASGIKQGPFRVVNQNDGHVAWDGTYVDGKKTGAVHYYTADGALELEIVYDRGNEVSRRFTLEGLRQHFAEKNAVARARGDDVRFAAPDEHTLEVDRRAGHVLSDAEKAQVRTATSTKESLCPLFKMPGTRFDARSIRVRRRHRRL